ncbi:MAG: PadR family transcriptional regulator [Firmicutes bacterium]|nr:PadR family transcriptional regulator [Bacillota bacterium]
MSVKLIILGLLMNGDKHPYEMQHFFNERRMDKLMKFYKGSLYYTVDQLREKGLIEVVEVVREEKRPDRTIYTITEAGRREFQELLLEQFSKEEQFYDPLYPAVIFARYGDQEKIQEVVDQKISATGEKIKYLEDMFEKRRGAISRPAHYIYLSLIEYASTELKLLRTFREDILKGGIQWDSSPGKGEGGET